MKYCKEHVGVRKECIKSELDEFCAKEGYRKKSISTGRIIKELKEEGKLQKQIKFSFNARSDRIKEMTKKVHEDLN